MNSHCLSWALLIVAYATYGQLLHNYDSGPMVWWITLAFVVIKASVITLLWQPVRDFVLKGFKTDVGYSIMVLAFASFAVFAVTQFRTFAYMVVLIAAALLVKVDCLVDGMGDRLSFVTLVLLSLVGLGISWLPFLLFQGAEFAA